jgi:hypothetical protein
VNARSPGRRWFWLGLVAGSPLIAIGVWGIFHDAAVTSPFNFALWFIGGNLVHDFLLAPAVVLLSFALRLVVSPKQLGRVQWGLALSAIVVLFALIPLLGLGKSPLEPTVQPLNYGVGLVIVLAAIWASTLLIRPR